MASGGAATSTPAAAARGSSKTVSASLWWDSFIVLSDDLDRAANGPSVPDALVSPLTPYCASHTIILGTIGCDRWVLRATGEADQGPPRMAPSLGLHVREAERGVEERAGCH
jgi:hypothetical protein